MKDNKIVKKVLFSLLLVTSISSAQMLNGIALSVNDEPITISDINQRVNEQQLKKAEAVSSLIDEILYEQEVQKQNITIDIFEINDYLEKLAASNGMDLYSFKSILRQKNKNFDDFEEETKKELIKRKLASKIIRGNLSIATEDDLKIYYNNNQNMFEIAQSIEITQYASKNKTTLLAIQKNPMAIYNDVAKEDIVLEQNKINPQLKYLINETQTNSYTPIFTANKHYVMFYIKAKNGVTTLGFEEVKDKIFNVLMNEREKKYLKEYFEKLKLSADIKVIR